MGAIDQAVREPEAGGDREGVTLAGAVIEEAEGGGEPLAVELYRGVARSGVGAGERFQRLEVGRGHDEGAAALEVLEDRLGERRSLVGVGAGSQLVQEHQRAVVHLGQDLLHLLHEGRERREVLRHALIVADHGEEPREDGEPASFLHRQVTAGLGQQRQEAEGLERHCFSARIRTGDHEERQLGVEVQVHGDDGAAGLLPGLGQEERVARP